MNEVVKNKHEILSPIYEYVKSIKDIEPDRDKRIAKILLELNIELEGIDYYE